MRRLLLAALALAVALPVAGVVFQQLSVRRDARRFPAPGRLVDIGGRRLHLMCTGTGVPTVVFESSGLGSALSFEGVRAELGHVTTICSYERMGMGWSDRGPREISVGLLANDLQLLLEHASVRPPYIFVPASIGGLTIEMFARRHPEQVAGLVFVDAADSGVLDRAADMLSSMRRTACLAGVAARVGLLRVIDPLRLRRQPDEWTARTMAMVYRAEPMDTLCGLLRGIPISV